jgi:signal transduction histidine kinase
VSRSRALSLRARMLVMLIGVTTVLLVVMGTVSTFLLARRVDGQISQLSTALQQDVQYLASRACLASADAPCQTLSQLQTAGSAVVVVPLGPQLAAHAVTNTPLTIRLEDAVDANLRAPGFAAIRALAGAGQLDAVSEAFTQTGCKRGDTSAAAAAGARFPYLDCRPFDVAKNIWTATGELAAGSVIPASQAPQGAIVFVGQPVSTGPDQFRGFLIAELITGAALIALLAVGGEWLIGRGLDPLDQMAATANEITTRGDLTARMPDADDQTEVGRLGSSINTMLDRIQQAFSMRLNSEQKVREFAADASHELRTPLTTIRGYAELYRQGALGPDQLPSAMRRIEQEAQRMSTLVAELLELARLDRTSSLDLTETDLASVVRDAVADAVAVEPQRPVRAEAPPRLVAVVDEPRVRQVLANLLGNVRTHTPVTTPVAVRLGAISGGVLIEVADAGAGMSAEDAIRAFDRFHRAAERSADIWAPAGTGPRDEEVQVSRSAHGSRTPAAALNGSPRAAPWPAGGNGRQAGGQPAAERSGGSGLGLSIVQAIANAHGGRATLESRPGKGTKVRVWLPVRIVP